MTALASRIVRIKATLGAAILSTPPKDVATNQTPETWRGNATTFQFGFFDTAGALLDLTDVSSINLKIRASQTYGSTVLADKTVAAAALDLTTNSTTWGDGTKQHAEFAFTNAEMNLDPAGAKKAFWLVVTAAMADGSEVTMCAGSILFHEDNNAAADPPPENPGTAATIEETDARYVRYGAAQSLTSGQQDQAATNIGATDDGATNSAKLLKTDSQGTLTVGGLNLYDTAESGYKINLDPTSLPLSADRIMRFPNADGTFVLVSSGTSAPATTPAALGQVYVDTSAGVIYVAKGTSSSADWMPFVTTSGAPIAYNATLSSYRKLVVSGADGSEIITISAL